MKAGRFLLLTILALTITASAQDWQHCKPDGSYSFAEVKDSVRSVTTTHTIKGSDVKAFNRSGDLVPFAIVQTLDDREMTAPQTLEEVLMILREAYACPARCVATSSDRQPRVALLLLEHLHNNTSGKMQSSVDETKEYIMQHGHSGE
jgi:hypothetical protein